MEVPILVSPLRGTAKRPIYEFRGVRYYRKPPTGYYKSDHPHGDEYLHRIVWEHHRGPIPDGYAVHHIDHNPANNRIENLELLAFSVHAVLHMADPERRASSRSRMGAVIKAAADWRRDNPARASEIGRAGMEAHRKKRAVLNCSGTGWKRKCPWCGSFFDADIWQRQYWCSPKCRSAARRASGVDDEDRNCIICGGSFRANRYTRKQTCSRDCTNSFISLRRS